MVKPARAWSWAAVGLLGAMCGILAILQYRWIGEVAGAERSTLQEELQARLNTFSRAVNQEIVSAVQALIPSNVDLESQGRERAYAGQYSLWKESHDRIFKRLALAVPGDGELRLLMLDLDHA